MTKYIVGINRPYYPSIEEFDNLGDAAAEYLQTVERENDSDPEYPNLDEGLHDSQVYLAKVIDMTDIKTCY